MLAEAVDEDGAHADRPRALDVRVDRVADHRGLLRRDLEQVEHGAEDRRVRLRLAVVEGADPGVDVERMMPCERMHVAGGVRDEPELQPAAELVEHRDDVLVQLEVLVPLPAARDLDGARVRRRSVPPMPRTMRSVNANQISSSCSNSGCDSSSTSAPWRASSYR